MNADDIKTTKSNSRKSVAEILKVLHKNNNNRSESPLSTLISEPGRFNNFSLGIDGLLLDFSRVQVDKESLDQLLKLAQACNLESRRDSLFDGAPVNLTENRPAMHMALRSRELGKNLPAEEFNAMESAMDRMLEFASDLHKGQLPADSGQRIRHIVHVGIGGSILGTRLLCEALDTQSGNAPEVHFLGSVDAHFRERLLPALVPEETVVILASKSFSTADTLMHGTKVWQWLESNLGTEAASQRMFAVSSDAKRAASMGVPANQVLYLPPWVGGRYSLWSPVSLAAAAIAGPEAFTELLDGAAEMDRHFQQADAAENLPILMGLLGVWHRNICGLSSWGVIPYDQRLRLLPAHLQQVIMESNGKSVSIDGKRLTHSTSPVVFGETGTDAQHSLFQAFHQGTDTVPLHMIAVIRPDHEDDEAHAELLANMLAQATALAHGRSQQETRRMMELGTSASEELVAHRSFDGNRPTELLMMDDLSPSNLGKLLALYEHKVFVESVIWGINAFDQWGVELGKSLAPDIRRALEEGGSVDPDLSDLLDYIRDRRRG
jgi:glucose-6-phosphate isomerase